MHQTSTGSGTGRDDGPSTHHVLSAALRAQVAQGEFLRNAPERWLPYVAEAFASLPLRVDALVNAGHPRSAEYWLLSAERFVGIHGRESFDHLMRALGSFELISADNDGRVA